MRLGSQRPRILVEPPNVVGSRFEDAVDVMALTGVILDGAQRFILEVGCSVRADGRWAAFEVGYEAPRRNGKTDGVIARILAGLFVWGERKIIYSAQQFNTAVETFNRLVSLIESTPALMSQVDQIRTGNDDRSITLKRKRGEKRGARVRFLARSGNSARGFDGDLIILDEAYDLNAEMVAAMLPTLAANSVDGDPQVWYMSSAGKVTSDVLNGLRSRAIKGEFVGRLAWLEWSTASSRDTEDVDGWYESNSALGGRVSLEFLWDELAAFRNDPELGEAKWRRERLGIRESIGGESAIDLEVFDQLIDRHPTWSDIVAFGIDAPPDRSSATIAAASVLPNGDVVVELVDRDDWMDWVPDRAAELKRRYRPKAFVIDQLSQAAALTEDLKAHHVAPRFISRAAYAQACGQVFDLIRVDGDKALIWSGQKELRAAVEGTTLRWLTDGRSFVWKRKSTLVDLSPLIAVTLAVAGLGRHRVTASMDAPKPRRLHIG